MRGCVLILGYLLRGAAHARKSWLRGLIPRIPAGKLLPLEWVGAAQRGSYDFAMYEPFCVIIAVEVGQPNSLSLAMFGLVYQRHVRLRSLTSSA